MQSPEIWTTASLLDAVAAAKKCRNDNQLSKAVGVDRSTVTLWRRGARFMSDDYGARCAELLGLDVGQVLACLALERVKDVRLSSELRRFLLAAATGAAAAVAGFAVLVLPSWPTLPGV